MENRIKIRQEGDRKKGKAPNQPLLLLSLLEIWKPELGERIPLEGQLGERFYEYWRAVEPRRGPAKKETILMPAVALKDLWTPITRDGGKVTKATRSKTTALILNQSCLELLGETDLREKLKGDVIQAYFEGQERAFLEGLILGKKPSTEKRREKEMIERAIRDARFRNKVKENANFQCQLTGRTYPSWTKTLDAAHIQSVEAGGADEEENGLALEPTAHRLFDQGAWGITPDLKIVVAKNFRGIWELGSYVGRKLQVARTKIPPHPEYLEKHLRSKQLA